ncbi:4-hydroxyproline epimerase [Shimia sp.]|uniref:4-hydroxyproline epimerase n=1 Tax=Shimia sp. TaxID=1954381 RepID=UPI00329954DF
MRHTFFCVDAHTCGNPVRVVVGGGPQLPSVSMSEKREIFQRDHDWVRQSLMFEPRGHDVMSGTILYPSSREDCEIGVLFIEVSGCLPMCGHGTIGTVTAALEEGLVVPREPGKLSIETPAGKVDIEYVQSGNYIEQVRLFNVPAYLHAQGVIIAVEGIGDLKIDLSYGGNYYAIVEPQENWAGLDHMSVSDIQRLSPLVRAAAQESLSPKHPEDARICGVSHVMWCDAPKQPGSDARNAVFYGEKAIDRSPCGTGSSARMAQLHARGRLKAGQNFTHESIICTTFDCRIEGTTKLGKFDAILPSVAGWARVIGHNTIFVDDRDPLMKGFQLR